MSKYQFISFSYSKVLVIAMAMIFGLSNIINAQMQDPSDIGGGIQATSQGGSATAGEFAPVLDSEKRPITAGGFVKVGPIVYQDITKQAGLSGWKTSDGDCAERLHHRRAGFGRSAA